MLKRDIISAVLIDSDDQELVFHVNKPTKTRQEEKPTKTQDQEEEKPTKTQDQEEEKPTKTQDQEEEKPTKTQEQEEKPKPKRKRTVKQNELNKYFTENSDVIEIGIDEVGRGPLFGRVYASAVVLPKTDDFKHCDMKDSKKFHSKSKIDSTAEYIKQNAIAWSICYEDENTIDRINILQATQSAMHNCITNIINQLKEINSELDMKKIILLIDGNYFKPFTYFNQHTDKFETITYHLIEQGDNKFTSIAAASILAKVERDKYIDELCEQYPELSEKYKINTNKGYGSKQHLDGIRTHGITQWHRKTFGICKNY
jgi:ribonuclease HII